MNAISPAQILLSPMQATSIGFDSIALAAVINGGLAIIIGLLALLFCRRFPSLFNKLKKNRLMSQANLRSQNNIPVDDIASNASYLDDAVDSQSLVSNTFIRWFQVRIIFTWGLILSLIWPCSQRRDRQKVARNLGSNYAIYFFFSQLLIYAFVLITAISVAVLLPVHLSTTDRSFFVADNITNITTVAPITPAPTRPTGNATCFGKTNADPTVCSGHGGCAAINTCECDKGYFGVECENFYCFGEDASNSKVCNSNGKCVSPDDCQCNSKYTGDQCTVPLCFGRFGEQACSKHGKCVAPDQCTCDEGRFGPDCSQWQCFNITNVDPTVCGGHGTCSDTDVCQCTGGYVGDKCQYKTCYTSWENDPNVCNGHGQCTGIDVCTCDANHAGNNCQLPKCNNLNAGAAGVCPNAGQCSINPGNCTCTTGNVDGQGNCIAPTCFGKASTAATACSGHGLCNGVNTCLCQGGYYGANCEGHFCYGFPSESNFVCTGRGTCDDFNLCTCKPGYSGVSCQDTICYGKSSANPAQVCNGHGSCNTPDKCTCNEGYSGQQCAYPICNSVDSSQVDIVCGGHGTCTAPNTCQCKSGYAGANCDSPICFGFNSTDSRVCSGHGTCTDPATCQCKNGYTGAQCQTPPVPKQGRSIVKNSIQVLYPDNSIAEYTSSRVAGDWFNSWANIIIAVAILIVIVGLVITGSCCMGLWMTSHGERPMEAEFIASPYVLQISNIDKSITDNESFRNLMITYNDNIADTIIKTSVVLDLAKPTRLIRKLEQVNKKLDHMEFYSEEKNKQPETNIWCSRDMHGSFHFKSKQDAITYYRREKQTLEILIKQWDRMYMNADKQKSQVPTHLFNDTNTDNTETDKVDLEVVADNGESAANIEIIDMDDTIQGTGLGFIAFKSVEAKHDFKRRFKAHKTHMKARNITFESEDIHWEAFYDNKQLSKSDMQRKRKSFALWGTIGVIIAAIILAVWVVPIAIASAYQSMVDLAPIQSASNAARGVAGAFLLQYIPTFVLFVTCIIGVNMISSWTNWETRKSFGKTARVSTVRSYIFLILAMLIVPLITIAVSDAIFIGPISNANVTTPVSLQQLFIPSTAIFFLTLIMHWTFLKNLVDAILASQMVRSLVGSIKFLSPREKLDAHRVEEMKLDREYAHLLAVSGVALCLSVTSPLVLPVVLGYLIIKYFVDRFNAQHAKYHGRFDATRAEQGADYMTQKKTVQMLAALVMVNVIIFFGFLSFYFGFKTQLSMYYLPHLIISVALAALSILSVVVCTIIVKTRINIDNNVALKNHFEPTTLLFEHLYEQPRLDEHGRERRKEYLAQQQSLRAKKMRSMKIIDVEYDQRSLAGLSPRPEQKTDRELKTVQVSTA